MTSSSSSPSILSRYPSTRLTQLHEHLSSALDTQFPPQFAQEFLSHHPLPPPRPSPSSDSTSSSDPLPSLPLHSFLSTLLSDFRSSIEQEFDVILEETMMAKKITQWEIHEQTVREGKSIYDQNNKNQNNNSEDNDNDNDVTMRTSDSTTVLFSSPSHHSLSTLLPLLSSSSLSLQDKVDTIDKQNDELKRQLRIAVEAHQKMRETTEKWNGVAKGLRMAAEGKEKEKEKEKGK